MASRELPDAHSLAQLVSGVTEVMCGTKFIPADDLARGNSICGRMVLLPIKGARDISVVLASDNAGSRALGAALFCRPADQLTPAMIDDAIAEVLNMVAGQIQRAMAIDQPLGLPRVTSLGEMAASSGVGFNDSVLLTSEGAVDLKLWIIERKAPGEGVPRSGEGGVLKSLIRKRGNRIKSAP
jgi:hypothetical protein